MEAPQQDVNRRNRPPMTIREKFMTAAIFIMPFSGMVAYTIIAPFFPIVATAKGLTKSTIGAVIACFEISNMISLHVANFLTPIMGIRFVATAGGIFCGGSVIGFALVSLLDNSEAFTACCFAFRTVEAVGAAMMMVAAYSTVGVSFPTRMDQVMPFLQGGYSFALIGGPPIGSGLYALTGYIPTLAITGGIVILVSAGAVCLFPGKVKTEEENTNTLGSFKILSFYGPLVTSTINGILYTVLMPMLALYLKEFGLTPTQGGLVFTIGPIAYVIGLPVSVHLMNRWNLVATQSCAGLFISCLGLLIAFPGPILHMNKSLPLVAVGLSIHGFGLITTNNVLFYCYMDALVFSGRYKRDAATTRIVGSITNNFHSVGALLGPVISGYLSDKLGMQVAMNVCVGGLLILSVAITVFMWYTKPTMSVDQNNKTHLNNEEKQPLLDEKQSLLDEKQIFLDEKQIFLHEDKKWFRDAEKPTQYNKNGKRHFFEGSIVEMFNRADKLNSSTEGIFSGDY